MPVQFPTPIYRFFSKEKYLNELVDEGIMRFTPVSAFTSLTDEKYRDEGEKLYKIKRVRHIKTKIPGTDKELIGGSIDHQVRKIDDAWAFCGTTSIITNARKTYCSYIKTFEGLMQELDKAIYNHFGEELLIMSGPVAYYSESLDLLSEVIPPPYFCKPEKFKVDLEYRIVIVPSDKIYAKGQILPLELKIKHSKEIFGKTIIEETQKY